MNPEVVNQFVTLGRVGDVVSPPLEGFDPLGLMKEEVVQPKVENVSGAAALSVLMGSLLLALFLSESTIQSAVLL